MSVPESTPTDLPLSSAKRVLLESWGRGNFTGGPDEPVIARAQTGQPIPLSFAQQRLWLLNQFENAFSVYNVPFAFHLAGFDQRKARFHRVCFDWLAVFR